jgi:sugar O-acyltransferase (sialic acid O-acetyltransferase NeuD family)
MLVLGAKGFSKEVLEILHSLNQIENIIFYDDVSELVPDKLFGVFPVIRKMSEAIEYFQTIDKQFALGLGNPYLRKRLCDKFESIGGDLKSTISPMAFIGSYDVEIGLGTNVLPGAIVSNGSKLGKGCILYYNSIVTHDCVIGDFVEISPGASILGRCKIGSHAQIGSNATILPDIEIGMNVVVGAGSVVTKDIPDNTMVLGVPARVMKELNSLNNI